MKRRELLKAGLAAGAALAGAGTAGAQSAAAWPTRPIKLVVPFPVAGNTDVVARFLGELLGPVLGQPVLVDNRAGASGSIGTQQAMSAAPDGYTFLMATAAIVTVTPLLQKVQYQPADMLPVARVTGSYGLAVARKDLPAKDFKEVAELAKKSPGRITFGTSGVGSMAHLTGEMINLKAGVQTLHVPYKGSAGPVNDLIGGQIDLIYDAAVLPAVKAGQVKAMAALGRRRHPELPDLPTLTEQGILVELPSWWGVFAPKGTPAPIVDRVAAALKQVLDTPSAQTRLAGYSQ